MVSTTDRVIQAFNAVGLFENTLIQVDELPKLSSSAKLVTEIFPFCKFYALSSSGSIVKQFFVPSASIPDPSSVIAALTSSSDRPDVVAILHAIENFDNDVFTLLGVEREDLRQVIDYRSEIVDSRLTHYPRTVIEREKIVLEFIIFLTIEIQYWIIDQLGNDSSPGPVFVLEQFANTNLQNRLYPLLTDVLTLLATSSSNKVVREMASKVVVVRQDGLDVETGWGGIRKRRPVEKHPKPMCGKRIIDQTIVMHEIEFLYTNMKCTILEISKSFIHRKNLHALSQSCKKTFSSLSTRAPPSIDSWPVGPLATAELEHKVRVLSSQLEESFATIASLKQTVHSKDFMISELSNHLVHLKAQIFAYADDIEDGIAETDLATLWTEIEKLKIEKKIISRQSVVAFPIHQELRKRDQIIDLLNFVIVRICGNYQQSDEVRFAVEKINKLMMGGEKEIQSMHVVVPAPPAS